MVKLFLMILNTMRSIWDWHTASSHVQTMAVAILATLSATKDAQAKEVTLPRVLGKPRATPRPVRNMEQNSWWVETFHCIELLNCINWSSVFQIMAYWILRNKSLEFQFMSQSNVGSGESKLHERSFRIAQQNRLFSLFGSTTSGSWKRTAAVSP